MRMKFPLGIDNFEKVRSEQYYYIDKTLFIKELLSKQFEASLVTRPRRFGKTLTMSMADAFFDISRDSKAYFEGLEIYKDRELCNTWLNQWPTIFLTLKSVEGLDFKGAYGMMVVLIANLCKKYAFLGESGLVDQDDKAVFRDLKAQRASMENLKDSLLLLTRMMKAHYGKSVILLIDEYDVPLASASEANYYQEMLDVIRALLGAALKTNPYLKFSVVTGCLRIAKESIFTGLNNFVTDKITGDGFNEYIGFTPADINKILADLNMPDHAKEMKHWYDGYRFGKVEVYCPWDVLNHVNALQDDPDKKPENYWGNTSHNGIIYRFISRKDLDVNEKFEKLMAGETIIETIAEDLTYDTLKSSEQNLWSFLYLTGYLTSADPEIPAESSEKNRMALRIPNEEVKSIFKTAIVEWFHESVLRTNRQELFEAMWNGDAEKVQKEISDLLFDTISYHDYQENYYHAFLAGLFAGAGYIVESNYEYGTGRPDIVVKDRKQRRALTIEVKHAKTEESLPVKCQEAVRQIKRRKYMEGIDKGYRTRLGYGIAFYEKECMVLSGAGSLKSEY